jgi:NAD(P)-dependent dehydrogenase (short-subunit alcohol dehydrogenase family)
MSLLQSRPFAVVADDPLGIGLELALRFAHDGYDLLIAAARGRHEAFAEALDDSDGRVEFVDADLGTPRGVHTLVDRIQAAPRPPDALALGGSSKAAAACISATQLWDISQNGSAHASRF